MEAGAEDFILELSPENAAVAMRAYETHGYRIVGLKYDGAYSPELEPDGRLVVDRVGAAALKACVFENVKYNLDFLYGKWAKVDGTHKFKPGILKSSLVSNGVVTAAMELEHVREFVARTRDKIRDSQRVNVVLIDFLEKEQAEEAAA